MTFLIVVITSNSASSAIQIGESERPEFKRLAGLALNRLEVAYSPSIQRLLRAAREATRVITIREITDDQSTWHRHGDRTRAHTQPGDGESKKLGRSTPVDAILFLPLDAIEPTERRWSSGVFVHELVHAVDLVYGRYHSDYRIRERRAVFFQNQWRADTDTPLRTHYHGRFDTLDFQDHQKRQSIQAFLRHFYSRPDLLSED